jgi:hypothetical protein
MSRPDCKWITRSGRKTFRNLGKSGYKLIVYTLLDEDAGARSACLPYSFIKHKLL